MMTVVTAVPAQPLQCRKAVRHGSFTADSWPRCGAVRGPRRSRCTRPGAAAASTSNRPVARLTTMAMATATAAATAAATTQTPTFQVQQPPQHPTAHQVMASWQTMGTMPVTMRHPTTRTLTRGTPQKPLPRATNHNRGATTDARQQPTPKPNSKPQQTASSPKPTPTPHHRKTAPSRSRQRLGGRDQECELVEARCQIAV